MPRTLLFQRFCLQSACRRKIPLVCLLVLALCTGIGYVVFRTLDHEDTVDYWIEKLRQGSFRERSVAARRLVALSPDSIPPLIELAKQGRCPDAWRCLSAIGDPATVAMVDLLSDRYDVVVREEAASGLAVAMFEGTISSPDCVAAVASGLSGCLNDRDPRIRAAGSWNLSRIGQSARSVVEPLRRALHDQDPWVRLHAADALSQLEPSDSRFRSTLVQLLCSDNDNEKEQALRIVLRMGVKGRFAYAPVRQIVADEASSIFVREVAIWTLAQLGEPAQEAVPLLQGLRVHEAWRVREAAETALKTLGGAKRGDQEARKGTKSKGNIVD
jgi:HEAT repeat protein